MNNITYLLGAGASANAIPLVKDFSKELNEFRNWVNGTIIRSPVNLITVRDKFDEDLAAVYNGCKGHYSIDTYAKKLYITKNKEELKKVKRILDAFLMYLHFNISNTIDERYDAFIAAILNEAINDEFYFPSNVKILSWNYDIQFELASRNYFIGLTSEPLCKQRLQMIPHSTNYKISTNRFSFVKLNGTSGAEIVKDKYKRKWQDYITFIKFPSDEGLLTRILHNYLERNDNNTIPSISFAWEHNPMSAHVMESAKAIASTTNILVSIGYSFPSFNRSIDKALLSEMKELKEIVIQVPEDSIKEVSSKVKSIRNDIEITPYTGDKEFHIPSAFFPEGVLEIKPIGAK